MYIPNKSTKYGIKLVFANDVHSKYLLAGIPYPGSREHNHRMNKVLTIISTRS